MSKKKAARRDRDDPHKWEDWVLPDGSIGPIRVRVDRWYDAPLRWIRRVFRMENSA